eukprot:TRINITY_DN7022_c0_g1_i1.p1 TRINITY_DN7022_c0_g1~~TRINITY_DN7022_c0_g1_i1.p1  ORF type:complete len:177 (-),score=35.78 TRINITY_DN7022_c0_g1_i1:11-484(-)
MNNLTKLMRFSAHTTTRCATISYYNRSVIRRFYAEKAATTFPSSASIEHDTPMPDIDKTRKRLYHQSKERGMLENDLLLANFSRHFLAKMTPEELKQYDEILQQNDPDIFGWVMGKLPIPESLNTEIMQKLIKYCKENPLDYRRDQDVHKVLINKTP